MKLIKKLSLFWLIILINILICTNSQAATTNVDSGAGLLVEVSTGKILYEKNSKKIMYPASTTKIMTAILVLENCKYEDIVTVSETALQNIPSGYVTCDLQVGEEISVKDLLYALMVKSANDAAYVLAEHVAGSVEAFADMMNSKAQEIGCTDTHFVNPNGIHNSEHYTTAYDLYLIAKYGMENENFRQLVSTTSYTLPVTNKYPNNDRTFSTTNELLIPNNSNKYYYKYAIGIKTGYTKEARNCLVAESSRDGLEFISVILDAGTTASGLNERFTDTIKLFNYGYDNFTLTKLKEKNTIVTTTEIKNATKETKDLDLLIEESITVIHNKEIEAESILPEININENLIAPISKGDTVGSIKYTVDNVEYSSKLLASHDVTPKADLSIYIVIAGFVLLIFALLIMPKKKKKSRKQNKRKK